MIAKKANNFTEFLDYIKKRYNVYYSIADIQVSYDLFSKTITFIHKNEYFKYSNSAYFSSFDKENIKSILKLFLDSFMTRTINNDFPINKLLYAYYMKNKISLLMEEVEKI